MKDFAKSIVCNTKVGNMAADITTDGNTWFVTTSDGKKKEFTSEREAEEYAKKVRTGNSKVENAGKTFSGKYLDIYDNGTVVVKEGYAFGEKFNKNSFDYWVKNEIQSKERILRECKAMKSEFDKNFI